MGIVMASVAVIFIIVFLIQYFSYRKKEQGTKIGEVSKDEILHEDKFPGIHISGGINLSRRIVDSKNYFSLGYCEKLGEYLLVILTSWVADYNRYYKITKEDYLLYETSKDDFYNKFEKEISQKEQCFSELFIGAAALRDYDGCNGFQKKYPSYTLDPFDGYGYYDGVLYAKINWENNITYVPPVQVIYQEDGEKRYPLREKSYVVKDLEDNEICYGLKQYKLSDCLSIEEWVKLNNLPDVINWSEVEHFLNESRYACILGGNFYFKEGWETGDVIQKANLSESTIGVLRCLNKDLDYIYSMRVNNKNNKEDLLREFLNIKYSELSIQLRDRIYEYFMYNITK